jgi:nicotinamidase/pyrazinamidase
MKNPFAVSATDLLLIVDLQNDFCFRGALAVPRGDEVVAPVNRLAQSFAHVVLTQDWHPKDHLSFASSHPNKKPYDTIELSYGPQILWPDHCVQGSLGAEFRHDLNVPHAALVLRKGFHQAIDSYSAFRENDRMTKTGLAGYLRERGFKRVFIGGLALDFCVRYSAEDAHLEGFAVAVIEDACRAIDVNGSLVATWRSLSERGITRCMAAEIG